MVSPKSRSSGVRVKATDVTAKPSASFARPRGFQVVQEQLFNSIRQSSRSRLYYVFCYITSELAMSANESPNQPSLPWRVASASIMGIFGGAARFALYSALNTETHGLDEFKELVEERHDIEGRQRGLITGSLLKSLITTYS